MSILKAKFLKVPIWVWFLIFFVVVGVVVWVITKSRAKKLKTAAAAAAVAAVTMPPNSQSLVPPFVSAAPVSPDGVQSPFPERVSQVPEGVRFSRVPGGVSGIPVSVTRVSA